MEPEGRPGSGVGAAFGRQEGAVPPARSPTAFAAPVSRFQSSPLTPPQPYLREEKPRHKALRNLPRVTGRERAGSGPWPRCTGRPSPVTSINQLLRTPRPNRGSAPTYRSPGLRSRKARSPPREPEPAGPRGSCAPLPRPPADAPRRLPVTRRPEEEAEEAGRPGQSAQTRSRASPGLRPPRGRRRARASGRDGGSRGGRPGRAGASGSARPAPAGAIATTRERRLRASCGAGPSVAPSSCRVKRVFRLVPGQAQPGGGGGRQSGTPAPRGGATPPGLGPARGPLRPRGRRSSRALPPPPPPARARGA